MKFKATCFLFFLVRKIQEKGWYFKDVYIVFGLFSLFYVDKEKNTKNNRLPPILHIRSLFSVIDCSKGA